MRKEIKSEPFSLVVPGWNINLCSTFLLEKCEIYYDSQRQSFERWNHWVMERHTLSRQSTGSYIEHTSCPLLGLISATSFAWKLILTWSPIYSSSYFEPMVAKTKRFYLIIFNFIPLICSYLFACASLPDQVVCYCLLRTQRSLTDTEILRMGNRNLNCWLRWS